MGLDALHMYVQSNLAPKYSAKLQALRTPAAVQAPIPPSREVILRHQAMFKAAIQQEEQRVSDTPGVKNEPPRMQPKLENDSTQRQTTSAAAEVNTKQTSTVGAQVSPKRPIADGAEGPAPKHPKMVPPTLVQGSDILPATRVPPSTPVQGSSIQPAGRAPPPAPVQGSSIQPVTRVVATLVALGVKPFIPQNVDSSKCSSILEALLDAYPEGLARLTSFTSLIATSSGSYWKYRWFCVTCIGTGVSFRDIKDASFPELFPCEEHPGCDWVSGHGLYIRFVGTDGQFGRPKFEWFVLL